MSSHNALGIRVIELPACKMAVAAGAALPEFDRWWSELDKQRADKFYPRDFMYHDAQMNQLVWLYALPAAYGELCPYPLHDFQAGAMRSRSRSTRMMRMARESIRESRRGSRRVMRWWWTKARIAPPCFMSSPRIAHTQS